jgi:hypothetical protein
MPDETEAQRARLLVAEARRLAAALERMRLAEYIELLEQPRRLITVNFVAGLARGVGIAVGFSVLGALTLVLLRRTLMLNLPVVGSLIADIVRIVQSQLGP